jgi:methionyl-tRNA formyltransferase
MNTITTNYQAPRIVFMGTPDFATASLEALIAAGMDVVAVVTVPDKPAGRGQKLHESAVKKLAQSLKIPVLQPEKLKNPSFLSELSGFKADLFVVVAFRMLPEVVWNMPPLGTINLHASLLPQYRGAAPINHAIINGETMTGVTTFQLQHEIDTGAILHQEKVAIEEDMSAGELHDQLMRVGSALIVKTVQDLINGTVQAKPQSEISADSPRKEAPKLTKEDGRIHWDQSADTIHNHIRGLSPYPGAYTVLDSKILKVYQTQKLFDLEKATTGTLATDGKSYVRIATQDGWIGLNHVQLEGKKRMSIEEFLRGYKIQSTHINLNAL